MKDNIIEITTVTVPRMMTIRNVAKTKILPENAIRVLVKQGKIPVLYSGNTAYIHFDKLVDFLNNLPIGTAI